MGLRARKLASMPAYMHTLDAAAEQRLILLPRNIWAFGAAPLPRATCTTRLSTGPSRRPRELRARAWGQKQFPGAAAQALLAGQLWALQVGLGSPLQLAFDLQCRN